MSSSTEDLKILFEAEKELLKTLKANFSLFIHDSKFAYLNAVDFKTDEPNEYVHHPINAFHMLLRLLDAFYVIVLKILIFSGLLY